jgi:hypothetical protein
VLWNPRIQHVQKHCNRHTKYDAWEEFAKAMGTTSGDCKRKMNNLLSSLRREKQKIRKNFGTGKGMHAIL